MKPELKILFSGVAALAVSAVIGWSAFEVLHELETEFERIEVLTEITDKTHALHVLTGSFQEESLRSDVRQAKAALASLEGLLTMPSRVPRERVLMKQLDHGRRELGPLVDQWFAAERAGEGVERERREILASQIRTKVQFISDDTKRLRDISQTRVLRAQKKAGGIIVALIGVLALANGTIYLFSMRSIVRAQRALERNQERLRISEERIKQAMAVAGLGTFEEDHISGEVQYSPVLRELMGFGPDERVTLASILEKVLPEEREAMVEAVKRAHDPAGTGTFAVDHRARNVAGRIRWITVRSQTSFEGEGKSRRPVRTIGAALDVTERKEAQAELERMVTERTAKLKELVGELEHFSYTITHDLKSPLRAMRGFAEIAGTLCAEGEVSKAKDFLNRISTAAERMDKLIADALSYSRTVRQELPLEDVDAGALLRGMLDSYPELQAERAGIQVAEPLPVVLANEAGLTQVFSNLLGNAVKFVRAGEKPEVKVWASRREGWVRIWVEDKGIGISPEMLPRVFDMFSRGSKGYEGTGIGLALVRKVVQRMGGKVGLESEEGKGSRFWVELKAGEAAARPGDAVPDAGVRGQTGTVLYVEDEEGDVMFMGRAFHQKGLAGHLQVVGDGRLAIEYLSGTGKYGNRERYPVPSLVLLDLNLPQVGGFGVLEWIRNNPDYARLPVVVFSSSTRADDRLKAQELGADEFVAKPSSGLKFVEVVEDLQRKWL